jgi:hypothetical protein
MVGVEIDANEVRRQNVGDTVSVTHQKGSKTMRQGEVRLMSSEAYLGPILCHLCNGCGAHYYADIGGSPACAEDTNSLIIDGQVEYQECKAIYDMTPLRIIE